MFYSQELDTSKAPISIVRRPLSSKRHDRSARLPTGLGDITIQTRYYSND